MVKKMVKNDSVNVLIYFHVVESGQNYFESLVNLSYCVFQAIDKRKYL